jgi:hypothetical protein
MATAAPITRISLKDQILDLSRQNQIGELSPFMVALLDQAILDGYYPDEDALVKVNDAIINKTRLYREQTGVETVVLGMSGGVDSALTAAIFKAAGFRVIGVTMPIHQEPSETERGVRSHQCAWHRARAHRPVWPLRPNAQFSWWLRQVA